MLYARSYLITLGLLLGAGGVLYIVLGWTDRISPHLIYTVIAGVAVMAALALILVGIFSGPRAVEGWADVTTVHEEGTVVVSVLALPVYLVLRLVRRMSGRSSAVPVIVVRRAKRARRRQGGQ